MEIVPKTPEQIEKEAAFAKEIGAALETARLGGEIMGLQSACTLPSISMRDRTKLTERLLILQKEHKLRLEKKE